ncbi:phospholipase [Streptomyces sp. NBRC 110611]|uniref:phospholipase n=1 Tax=Streptomyces sp. NBRC 110611 TaxID=1621259 RepID=UPI0008328011|nr:phospholipase [Streptomyces sp. NBRC 110611]
MGDFQAARKARVWAKKGIDWSSDGCSWAPDKPYGFNFLPSCQRHDFGYRNLKKQQAFNEARKKRVDAIFAKDMYAVCDKYSNPKRGFCKTQASYYYAAVRKAG